MSLTCYLIRDPMNTVVHEYWAERPLIWTGTHYPWAADGFTTEVAAVQPAVAPAYGEPVGGPSMAAFDFVRRFTITEHATIVASADPIVKAFYNLLTFAAAGGRQIYRDDPDTAAGMAYLTAQGILAAGRVDEIWAVGA